MSLQEIKEKGYLHDTYPRNGQKELVGALFFAGGSNVCSKVRVN